MQGAGEFTEAAPSSLGATAFVCSTGFMHACEGVMKSLRSVKVYRNDSGESLRLEVVVETTYQSPRKRHVEVGEERRGRTGLNGRTLPAPGLDWTECS